MEELVVAQQVASLDGGTLVWGRDLITVSDAPHPAQSELQTQDRPAVGSAAILRPPATKPATGERRQLTVMFCDLVDSTELAQRIDPEELRIILRDFRSV